MNDQAVMPVELRLPSTVMSKLDLAHLLREVEQLDSDLTTVAARAKVGTTTQWQPVFSQQLTDFLALNPVELVDAGQRTQLIQRLRQMKDGAPVIHMTFASVADRESLQKIVDWLRGTIHPQAVISVGLQPDLVGGVYVRTSNHVHDLSMRARLAGHRDLITQEVEALCGNR